MRVYLIVPSATMKNSESSDLLSLASLRCFQGSLEK